MLLFIFIFAEINEEEFLDDDPNESENLCDPNNCFNSKIKNSDIFKCCIIEDEGCVPVSYFLYYLYSEGKPIIREMSGYAYYTSEEGIDIEGFIEGDCKNGRFSFTEKDVVFSQTEKQTFVSENHCLKYINKKIEVESEQTCENAALLDDSKSKGIKCGYFHINIDNKDGTKIDSKTCFPISQNFNQYYVKGVFSTLLVDYYDYNGGDYKLEIKLSGEVFATYDSKTDVIESKYMNSNSDSTILNISKFLFLLLNILSLL